MGEGGGRDQGSERVRRKGASGDKLLALQKKRKAGLSGEGRHAWKGGRKRVTQINLCGWQRKRKGQIVTETSPTNKATRTNRLDCS